MPRATSAAVVVVMLLARVRPPKAISGAEAKREHDERRVEEEQFAFSRGEEVARDIFDPGIRAEFDRADEGVGEEEDEEEERAEREARDDADGDQEDTGEVEAEVIDVEDWAEDVTEED